MDDRERVIRELSARLDVLSRQQQSFQEEIQRIRHEVRKLTAADEPKATTVIAGEKERVGEFLSRESRPQTVPQASAPGKWISKTAWEEFIGTNLLNKIGIAVLVIGVGFGAKYAIDHGALDALTRTILGYLSGTVLLMFAFRLRDSHSSFSAVLLSGGMAVFYFITFAAYSFHGLIPQLVAFALMVMFTVFTVLAAVRYGYEVIGIIGLAGAYAVPLLLSDGSGRVTILFSYITIINGGILFLAFRKYWKRLYYVAFALTWLTFASWYAFSFESDSHLWVSLVFSTLFFVTFYITFLAYKVLRREPLATSDVVCMLLNSFVYFGYGFLTIDSVPGGDQYLGLFTLLTAVIHFLACLLINKTQARLTDIFYFVAGLVLVFLTIAVPVQLEGNWVTLVWAAEACLLFWIGRTKLLAAYEKIGYALVVLAFVSLLHDWSVSYPDFYYYSYGEQTDLNLFFNIQFFTSIFVCLSFICIVWLRSAYPADPFLKRPALNRLIGAGLPAVTAFIAYVAFYKEIEAFWNNRYAASYLSLQSADGVEYSQYDNSVLPFRTVWLSIYTVCYALILGLLQWRWRSLSSVYAAFTVSGLALLYFIVAGLVELGDLRAQYLSQQGAEYYPRGYGHIFIRYVALVSVAMLLFVNTRLLRFDYFTAKMRHAGELYFHFIVLALLSSELVHWFDMMEMERSFRLSLSILWGAYALYLIVTGLSRGEKHIRVGAIVLFGVTLLKLFAYDMEEMSTILKTVVMIMLGALLLIASFIYNKYKRSAGNEA